MTQQFWLMKSEPSVFGIEELKNSPQQTAPWDGVRNYQARNYMRQMRIGDQVFFYHSNCAIPGIVGIARITREAYPDYTAWDENSHYFDPKSSAQNPRWIMVDVTYENQFAETLPLKKLYEYPELQELPLVRKGNRLSVMPVTPEQWSFILQHSSRR